MKAQLIVQRGLQKKQEMIRAAKIQKKKKKFNGGGKNGTTENASTTEQQPFRQKTNSAGGSGAVAARLLEKHCGAASSSAPVSTEKGGSSSTALNWIPDDPLGDIDTAQLWDWHKGSPLSRVPPRDMASRSDRHGSSARGVEGWEEGGDDIIGAGDGLDMDGGEEAGCKDYHSGDATSARGSHCGQGRPFSRSDVRSAGSGSSAASSRHSTAKSEASQHSQTPTLPNLGLTHGNRHGHAPGGSVSKKLPAKLANSPFALSVAPSKRPKLPVVKGSTQAPNTNASITTTEHGRCVSNIMS